MSTARLPQRLLFFDCANYSVVIADIRSFLECAQAGLMGEKLRESDLVFAGLRELGPEFSHAPVESDVSFLQRVQQTRAPQSFRGRPEEDNRVGRPRLFAFRIPKSAVEFEDRFAVLPDRDRSPELAEAGEVFVKKCGNALEFHRRA